MEENPFPVGREILQDLYCRCTRGACAANFFLQLRVHIFGSSALRNETYGVFKIKAESTNREERERDTIERAILSIIRRFID